ncbi:MAG: hypothetical protein U9N49_13250 [Campylobacterota bacterium]|nr:hypothetical protein [Campylobacterota bacterium]
MKKIIKLILITLSVLALSSCGGKSGGSGDIGNQGSSDIGNQGDEGGFDQLQTISIDALCNEENDISAYTPLQSADVVTKEEDNTTINIIHNQENQKVVCIEHGKASILRAK